MDEGSNAGGLPKKFAALGKLTKIESALRAAIESSRVPAVETRKLLKSSSSNQVKNTAVYQFMCNLFEEIGLGKLEITKKENFYMVFQAKDNPVSNLYNDISGKKTCYIISDALADFFVEDLNIPSETTESNCVNEGDEHCVFRVEMQPLAVYRIALDTTDEKIIKHIKDETDVDDILSQLGLIKPEFDYRLDTLKNYHIIRDDLTLTKIGQTYYKYGKSVIDDEDEDFEPPWKTMSMISGKIADSSSFAEALSRGFQEETSEEEIKDGEVVNLAKEADKSKSFAQLVSKTLQNKDKNKE